MKRDEGYVISVAFRIWHFFTKEVVCVQHCLNVKVVSLTFLCAQGATIVTLCIQIKRSRSAIQTFKLSEMMPKHCYKHKGKSTSLDKYCSCVKAK